MLIKNARLIDPLNDTEEICHILIENGVVEQIIKGGDFTYNGEEIDASGLITAPGLVDVHAHFRDPGQTEKETLHTGAAAAAAGGYTSVVCMANTSPAVDNTKTLKDVLNRAISEKIHIYQTAAVTKGRSGRELTDMPGLITAGAAGFTDDGTAITDEALVRTAMQDAAQLGAVLSFHEEDPAFVKEAGINKGRISDAMGIYGADRKAEYSLVERDIKIALETGARIDIQHVSAKESVEIIREYKAKDRNELIHAEATPHHFSLTDDAIIRYGSNAKVNPPLRTDEDRIAVIEGIRDETLDIIATDHAPHTSEEKSVELIKAPSGMVGLETALSLAITNLVAPGYITLPELVKRMSYNPAKLYGLKAGRIEAGAPADIVIFDPENIWTVSEEMLHSRSKNSPFIGTTLKGRVIYTVSNGIIVYSKDGQEI